MRIVSFLEYHINPRFQNSTSSISPEILKQERMWNILGGKFCEAISTLISLTLNHNFVWAVNQVNFSCKKTIPEAFITSIYIPLLRLPSPVPAPSSSPSSLAPAYPALPVYPSNRLLHSKFWTVSLAQPRSPHLPSLWRV